MTHAYNEMYLGKTQVLLGNMLHFAVYDLKWEAENFWKIFIDSPYSKSVYAGEPKYVVGESGVELAYLLYHSVTGKECKVDPTPCIVKTPEYYAGWALAYYSWYRNRPYDEINRFAPIRDVILSYHPYHEMDIMQFVDMMDRRCEKGFSESAIRRLRTYAKLTQRELAEKSGVSQRMIEQYEQGRKQITHASADTVYALSKALGCRMEQLMEA